MSTASFLETSMILESLYGADGVRDLDLLIAKAQISLVPVDEDQAQLARKGFQKFGKGRHPAGLNFGECLADQAEVLEQAISNYRKLKKLLRSWEAESERLIDAQAGRQR